MISAILIKEIDNKEICKSDSDECHEENTGGAVSARVCLLRVVEQD